MKEILMSSMIGAAAVLFSSCASEPAATGSTTTTESTSVTYDAAEQSLLAALNASRSQSGKPALKVSSKLTALARAESGPAASATQFPSGNTGAVQRRSGFNSIGKLQGTLKDRGPQTGASFLDYWKKDPAETLTGDWSHVGIGISKSADGRLFAVMILGGSGMSGGASLMTPAMSPGGF